MTVLALPGQRISDKGPLVAAPVQLDGAGGTGCHEAAVCGDGFPQAACCGQVCRGQCGIIVLDDLDLTVHQAQAGSPLPRIAVQVCNAGQIVVVVPAHRARAGQGQIHFAAAVVVGRGALLPCVRMVSAVVVVAAGHKAVGAAPQLDSCVHGIGSQRPALALAAALAHRSIKVHVDRRGLHGQAAWHAVHQRIVILADAEVGLLHAVQLECGQHGIITHAHVLVGQLVDGHHHRRQAELVQQNGVLAARDTLNGSLEVSKISHSSLLLSLSR